MCYYITNGNVEITVEWREKISIVEQDEQMKKKNGTYHIQTFEQYLRSSHHHSSMEPQKTTRFSNYSWKLIEKPPRAQYVEYIKRLTVRTNIFNLILCCCRFQRKKKTRSEICVFSVFVFIWCVLLRFFPFRRRWRKKIVCSATCL